jgi:hypothetical protein
MITSLRICHSHSFHNLELCKCSELDKSIWNNYFFDKTTNVRLVVTGHMVTGWLLLFLQRCRQKSSVKPDFYISPHKPWCFWFSWNQHKQRNSCRCVINSLFYWVFDVFIWKPHLIVQQKSHRHNTFYFHEITRLTFWKHRSRFLKPPSCTLDDGQYLLIIRLTRIDELGTLFLVRRFISTSWRRRYVPPRPRYLQGPRGITSQETVFFIVAVVKASHLTQH